MTERVAILDLGTNTFHLLIAAHEGSGWKIMYRDRLAVKLGQGGINQSKILPEATDRAVKALQYFKSIITEKQVSRVLAYGTSAIRTAQNRNDFIQCIKEQTGIEIRVLSGDEEAELIFYGVRKALQLENEKALIVDIGGGSVEFIIAGSGHMQWWKSLEIGAQRLLEKFQHHDPILPEEIELLNEYLSHKLQPVMAALQRLRPSTLAGSSGTFDTLSDIYCLRKNIRVPDDAPESPLTFNAFEEIYRELISKNRSERLEIPGMIEMRVDMIVVTCCLIKYLTAHYTFSSVRVSRYAMKEGILDQLDNINH
jgi:exopolyphosphatase/guanosine-5'-triphosphate,3'-diphosphate pyrophosphatase